MRHISTTQLTIITITMAILSLSPQVAARQSGLAATAQNGLTLTNPTGGERFTVGDSMTVNWQLDSGTFISDAVVLEISTNGGRTYLQVGGSIMRSSAAFKACSKSWLITDSLYSSKDSSWHSLRSDSCKLYLHGYSNYVICDYSGIFSIAARPSQHAHRAIGSSAAARGLTVDRSAAGFILDASASGARALDVVAPSGRLIRSITCGGPARHALSAADLPRGVCLAVLRAGAQLSTAAIIVK